MADLERAQQPMEKWDECPVPRVGTIWRGTGDMNDGQLYEVIGHDVHSPLNVVLRPLTGLVYDAANRFYEGQKFHRYEDVTEAYLREMSDAGS